MTRASAKTIRRTWRGVAPAVRSRPNSRLRWATAKENVEATTKTETKPVIAAAVPRSALTEISASLSRSGSGSARRRSSPVRTTIPDSVPTALRTAAASAYATTASTRGESLAASESVKNAAVSKSLAPTVPTTVRLLGPSGVVTLTRSPSRTSAPGPAVTTISWDASGARPPVSRYGVAAVTDHGCPTVPSPPPSSRVSATVTENERSSTVRPSSRSLADRLSGTALGSARRCVRSPIGVRTRSVSDAWTTAGAAAKRSGPRSRPGRWPPARGRWRP